MNTYRGHFIIEQRTLCDLANSLYTVMACRITPAVYNTAFNMEVAICAPPKRLADQLSAIFPGVGSSADLLVVPTCQRAECDLAKPGDAADAERERLQEQFVRWAVAVCGRLSSAGYWCDYVNPSTGLPVMHNETDTPYPEADGAGLLLGHRIASAGSVKVAFHPKWGSSSFPATLFARAPAEAVKAAIKGAEAQLR